MNTLTLLAAGFAGLLAFLPATSAHANGTSGVTYIASSGSDGTIW